MKRNKTLLILFFFLSQFANAQIGVEKSISGKVTVDSVAVEKINVINTRNEKATITNKEGLFFMRLKVGDILIFSAVNLETRRKVISEADLRKERVNIIMSPKVNRLKEVTVNENANINAENMGIIPPGQKKYTPAERKLATAGSGKSNPMGLDPLLNRISGRTQMLKKEVLVEKKEKLLVKLDGLYEDKYYTEILKIPQDYIKGFQYYLIEDPAFVNAVNVKNKTLTMFLVKKLALDYNEIIKLEEN